MTTESENGNEPQLHKREYPNASSTSLLIREMQIKITGRNYYIHTNMAKLKMMRNTK